MLVIWLDRKLRLGYGRAFAVYVMAYTAGRAWIEYLRIDTANHFFGVRLNVWTSVVLFMLAAAYFVIVGRRHPGREEYVEIWDDDEDDGRRRRGRRRRRGCRPSPMATGGRRPDR